MNEPEVFANLELFVRMFPGYRGCDQRDQWPRVLGQHGLGEAFCNDQAKPESVSDLCQYAPQTVTDLPVQVMPNRAPCLRHLVRPEQTG